MKIEDIKIEDAEDANYVIKKFFNNDYKNIKMAQLEQLVLTVYNLGKKNGVSADGAPDESQPKPADKAPAPAPVKTNTFKVNDRVKTIEDVEIGRSGEFLKPDNVGIVTLIKGDIVTVLYELGEDGEMMEVNINFEKLEKA